jgi:hypothetical protein
MRPGGGKAKGSSFERQICGKLSFWVTHGKRDDCMWRSAISGGRATVRFKKGKTTRSQTGDICSVAREAEAFLNTFIVECKHVKSLDLEAALVHCRGFLVPVWHKLEDEAAKHSKRPLLIARQNRMPTLVFLYQADREKYFGSSMDCYRLAKLDKISTEVFVLDDLLDYSSYRAHKFR